MTKLAIIPKKKKKKTVVGRKRKKKKEMARTSSFDLRNGRRVTAMRWADARPCD